MKMLFGLPNTRVPRKKRGCDNMSSKMEVLDLKKATSSTDKIDYFSIL